MDIGLIDLLGSGPTQKQGKLQLQLRLPSLAETVFKCLFVAGA
jgi:hypothetical protein